MKENDKSFTFTDNIVTTADKDTFIARIPKGISNVYDLFSALFDILNLPGYFGFNWNALYDCLCDFHWIDQHNIILIHEDLPDLKDESTLYLEVLHDAVNDWASGESHQLIVVFPKAYQDEVENIIKKRF